MGRVQRAVRSVLYEAYARGERSLSTEDLTVRTFSKLCADSRAAECGWFGPSPREHHYAAIRRALRTLGDHDPGLRIGSERE